MPKFKIKYTKYDFALAWNNAMISMIAWPTLALYCLGSWLFADPNVEEFISGLFVVTLFLSLLTFYIRLEHAKEINGRIAKNAHLE